MKKIYIKTTESCNLCCDHCYIGEARTNKRFFDEKATIAWLKDYMNINGLKNSDLYISFHGGEPFLCPTEKMEKVCQAFPGAQFDATTNLTFTITDDMLRFFKANLVSDGRCFIKTSWDKDIRFNSNAQESLWQENIKRLKNEGIYIKVNVCLTTRLLRLRPQNFLLSFSKLGIDELHFERLTYNTTEDKTLIPDYKTVDQWLLSLYKLNPKIEIDNFTDIKRALKGEYVGCRKRTCMKDVLTINADGSVGACPNSSLTAPFTSIYEKAQVIYDKRLELIKMEELRNISCYSCDYFCVCNGDCCQLSFLHGECPFPKNLAKAIKNRQKLQCDVVYAEKRLYHSK